jgi:hypothetical protein
VYFGKNIVHVKIVGLPGNEIFHPHMEDCPLAKKLFSPPDRPERIGVYTAAYSTVLWRISRGGG